MISFLGKLNGIKSKIRLYLFDKNLNQSIKITFNKKIKS